MPRIYTVELLLLAPAAEEHGCVIHTFPSRLLVTPSRLLVTRPAARTAGNVREGVSLGKLAADWGMHSDFI